MAYDRDAYLRRREHIIAYRQRYKARFPNRVRGWAREWRKRNLAKARQHELASYYRHWHERRSAANAYERRMRHTDSYQARKKRNWTRWCRMNPLRAKMHRRLCIIRQRCNDRNSEHYIRYGKRGIQCLLTVEDLLFLWKRDKAQRLRWASVDRIDPEGSYTRSNCRFIEFTENVSRASRRRWDRLRNAQTHG